MLLRLVGQMSILVLSRPIIIQGREIHLGAFVKLRKQLYVGLQSDILQTDVFQTWSADRHHKAVYFKTSLDDTHPHFKITIV